MMNMVIGMMMKLMMSKVRRCITCTPTYALANNPSYTGQNSSEPGDTFFNYKDDDLDGDHHMEVMMMMMTMMVMGIMMVIVMVN